jgi:NADPH:quinone reductase-like Zn-dependent oxidoreductase
VFAVQLAVRTGTCVIALASERHHAWLHERGAVPVAYGDLVRERIDTIVDFPAVQKYGVKTEGGAAAASAATLAELAEAIAAGDLVVPIQRTYPLNEVRAAFTELEAGHIAGKIVLIP